MRRALLPIVLATGLFGASVNATAAGTEAAPVQPQASMNFFDPSTWMTPGTAMPQAGATVQWNPANPAGWAMFIDPNQHGQAHMAFMNPATYGQFMQPNFYMQFANPQNWMSWMNPAAYSTFMNPATYMGWMNPGAWTHAMNPGAYMQWMNPAAYAPFMSPATYMQWMNPQAFAMPAAATTPGAINFADPNAWMKMFDPNALMQYGQPQAQATAPAPATPQQTQ
jgi:hypothetical protein